jgi:hypothetical protein
MNTARLVAEIRLWVKTSCLTVVRTVRQLQYCLLYLVYLKIKGIIRS